MEWIAMAVAVLAAVAACWQALEARKSRLMSEASSAEAAAQASASLRSATALEEANLLQTRMQDQARIASEAADRRRFAADLRALVDDDGIPAIVGAEPIERVEHMERELIRTARAAADPSYLQVLNWIRSRLRELRSDSAPRDTFHDFVKFDQVTSLGRRVSDWAEDPTSLSRIVDSENRRLALVRALNSVTSAEVTPVEE